MLCSNCEMQNNKDSKFCKQCGHNLQEVLCVSCSSVLTSDSLFCANCGTKREDIVKPEANEIIADQEIIEDEVQEIKEDTPVEGDATKIIASTDGTDVNQTLTEHQEEIDLSEVKEFNNLPSHQQQGKFNKRIGWIVGLAALVLVGGLSLFITQNKSEDEQLIVSGTLLDEENKVNITQTLRSSLQ